MQNRIWDVVRETQAYYDGAADRIYREIWGENIHLGLFENGEDSLPDAMRRSNEAMAERAEFEPEHHVLEVGCGDGRLTWRYAEAAAMVLAMDTNGEKIARATGATPASLRSKTRFLVADIADVELSPDAYDVAILAHSL